MNSNRKFSEEDVPVCISAVTYSSEHWETQQRTELIWLNMDRCFILILILGTGITYWTTDEIEKFKIIKPQMLNDLIDFFIKKYIMFAKLFCFIICWFTILCLLLIGLVAGDNIEPDKGTEKTSKEGEKVKLSCSLSTSSQNARLYWYRQYSNGGPQYLLYKNARSASDAHTSDDRFQSTASLTSTELTITDVRLSDSALYYCALRVVAQWYKTWDMSYKNLKLFSLWTHLVKNHNQKHNLFSPECNKICGHTCARRNWIFIARHKL